VQFRAAGGPTGCDKEIDQNLTLSFYTDYRDLSGGGGVVLCYVWAFFSDDFEVTATTSLNSSGNETMAARRLVGGAFHSNLAFLGLPIRVEYVIRGT
jgi:hypothetical protein